MGDLDLRTLSAPIEAMRSKVNAAYKLLDEQWKAIVAQLSELPIPCSVSYAYSSDDLRPEEYHTLEWRKMKGGRRLCSVFNSYGVDQLGTPYDTEDVTPFEEWGAEHKLEMLQHVPGLFKAAAEQTEAFVKKIHGKGGGK